LTRKLTIAGLMTALALALSYLEHLIPLQAVVPIPGIKLGLANIVTLFALICLEKRYAFGILIARCVLQTLFFGSVTSFCFSISGGILSLVVMSGFVYGYPRFFSVIGISIAGAACHNIGQILCAMLFFQSIAVLSYLPVLLLLCIISGALTGYIGTLVVNRLDHLDLKIQRKTGKD
jgi:heptaprenyl diphosphate synthase